MRLKEVLAQANDHATVWLVVYLIGSIPVLMFYAAGFAGWFFDYPMPLFILCLVVLAIPLVLILLKSPKAARWNIFMLRTSSILLMVRIVSALLFQRRLEDRPPISGEELLVALPMLLGIAMSSLAWTMIWTKYFKSWV